MATSMLPRHNNNSSSSSRASLSSTQALERGSTDYATSMLPRHNNSSSSSRASLSSTQDVGDNPGKTLLLDTQSHTETVNFDTVVGTELVGDFDLELNGNEECSGETEVLSDNDDWPLSREEIPAECDPLLTEMQPTREELGESMGSGNPGTATLVNSDDGTEEELQGTDANVNVDVDSKANNNSSTIAAYRSTGWRTTERNKCEEGGLEPPKDRCNDSSNDTTTSVTPEPPHPCDSDQKESSNLSSNSKSRSLSISSVRATSLHTAGLRAKLLKGGNAKDLPQKQEILRNDVNMNAGNGSRKKGCQSVRKLFPIGSDNSKLGGFQKSGVGSVVEEKRSDNSKHGAFQRSGVGSVLEGKGNGNGNGNGSVLIDSQEPGEESQVHALNMVEKLLWLNASGIVPHDTEMQIVQEEQPNIPSAKGMRTLARTADTKMKQDQMDVYDWVDSQQDEEEELPTVRKDEEETAASRKKETKELCKQILNLKNQKKKSSKPHDESINQLNHEKFEQPLPPIQHDVEEKRSQSLESIAILCNFGPDTQGEKTEHCKPIPSLKNKAFEKKKRGVLKGEKTEHCKQMPDLKNQTFGKKKRGILEEDEKTGHCKPIPNAKNHAFAKKKQGELKGEKTEHCKQMPDLKNQTFGKKKRGILEEDEKTGHCKPIPNAKNHAFGKKKQGELKGEKMDHCKSIPNSKKQKKKISNAETNQLQHDVEDRDQSLEGIIANEDYEMQDPVLVCNIGPDTQLAAEAIQEMSSLFRNAASDCEVKKILNTESVKQGGLSSVPCQKRTLRRTRCSDRKENGWMNSSRAIENQISSERIPEVKYVKQVVEDFGQKEIEDFGQKEIAHNKRKRTPRIINQPNKKLRKSADRLDLQFLSGECKEGFEKEETFLEKAKVLSLVEHDNEKQAGSRTRYMTRKRSSRNSGRIVRSAEDVVKEEQSSEKNRELEKGLVEKHLSKDEFHKGPQKKKKLTVVVEDVMTKLSAPLVGETCSKRLTRASKRNSSNDSESKKKYNEEKVNLCASKYKDSDDKIISIPVIPKGLRKQRKVENTFIYQNVPFVTVELSRTTDSRETRRKTRTSDIANDAEMNTKKEEKGLPHKNEANIISKKKPENRSLKTETCRDVSKEIKKNIVKPTTWEEGRRRKREPGCVRILFSHSLSDDVLKHQKKILVKLGGCVAVSAADCTHFVADMFTRSRNMLEAIAGGKFVVTTLWLEGCSQARYFVDEMSYILRDKKKEKELGFLMLSSLAAAQQRPLLMGFKVVIGPNTTPDPESMVSIIEAAGGQAVQDLDATADDDMSFVISCDKEHKFCVPFLDKGMKIYSTELILSGIPAQKLDFSRHQIFTGVGQRRRASKCAAKR